MQTTSPRLRSDDGNALVEFAFVVPLLIVLLLGVFETGMVFRDRNQFESAIRLAIRTDSNLGNARLADYNGVASFQAALGGLKNIKINYLIIYRGTPVVGTSSSPATNPVPPGCVADAESSTIKDAGGAGTWGGTGYTNNTGYGRPNTTPPDPGASLSGTVACNIFSRRMLASAPSVSNFGNVSTTPFPTTCGASDWDRFWCPVASPSPATYTGRDSRQSGNRTAANDPTTANGPDVIGMYASYTYTTYTKMFVASTITMTDTVVARLEPSIQNP
jgi:hypothetical protein